MIDGNGEGVVGEGAASGWEGLGVGSGAALVGTACGVTLGTTACWAHAPSSSEAEATIASTNLVPGILNTDDLSGRTSLSSVSA